MATKRRGGFRTPELRGTLGTLLRTTTDVVRGALERGAREGRARLDDVRANRRRQDALAELGDIVLDLIRRGEIDLAELPEARDLVRQLDDIDAEDAEPEPPRAVTRRRFDDRATGLRAAVSSSSPRYEEDDGVVASAARPRRDDEGVVASAARPRRDDDGVVASGARPRRDEDGGAASGARPRRDADDDGRFARPTLPARPRHYEVPPSRLPTKPLRTAARPESDEEEPAAPPRRPSLTLPHDPHRKGGISFDDDDLNEYMHPDDVPAKSPAKDPDGGDA